MAWVIELSDTNEDLTMYWSKLHGWVFCGYDLYSDEEHMTMRYVPLGGKWVHII